MKHLFTLIFLALNIASYAQSTTILGNTNPAGINILKAGRTDFDSSVRFKKYKAPIGDTLVLCTDSTGNMIAVRTDIIRAGSVPGGGASYYPGYFIKIDGDTIRVDTSALAGYFVRQYDTARLRNAWLYSSSGGTISGLNTNLKTSGNSVSMSIAGYQHNANGLLQKDAQIDIGKSGINGGYISMLTVDSATGSIDTAVKINKGSIGLGGMPWAAARLSLYGNIALVSNNSAIYWDTSIIYQKQLVSEGPAWTFYYPNGNYIRSRGSLSNIGWHLAHGTAGAFFGANSTATTTFIGAVAANDVDSNNYSLYVRRYGIVSKGVTELRTVPTGRTTDSLLVITGGIYRDTIKKIAPLASTYFSKAQTDSILNTLTTNNIDEGSNLYYTNTRARSAVSLTTAGTSGAATYNTTTGVLNIPQYTGGGGGAALTISAPLTGTVYDGSVPVNIGIQDAGTSQKGAASFSSSNFTVSSGAVSIKSGGVDLTTNVTGTLPVANGGTGNTSATAYALLAGGTSATAAYQSVPMGIAGQVLISNGTSALPFFISMGAANTSNTSGNAVNVATTETQIGGDIAITPSSSSAKIKITAYVSMTKDAGTTVRTGAFRIKNATATATQVGKDIQATSANVAANPFGATLSVIDAPGTTATQTYRFYGQMSGAACSTSAYYFFVEELTPAGAQGATGTTGATGPAQGISVNTQSGTSYTLQASDNGKVVEFTSNSAVACTLPSGLGTTFGCTIMQAGSGQVTLSASGTTIQNRQSFTKTAGQYASFVILPTGTTNTYRTQGDMQ